MQQKAYDDRPSGGCIFGKAVAINCKAKTDYSTEGFTAFSI